jgi:hypothetical protein
MARDCNHRVPWFDPRLRCERYDHRGADARPKWREACHTGSGWLPMRWRGRRVETRGDELDFGTRHWYTG